MKVIFEGEEYELYLCIKSLFDNSRAAFDGLKNPAGKKYGPAGRLLRKICLQAALITNLKFWVYIFRYISRLRQVLCVILTWIFPPI